MGDLTVYISLLPDHILPLISAKLIDHYDKPKALLHFSEWLVNGQHTFNSMTCIKKREREALRMKCFHQQQKHPTYFLVW